MRLIPGIVLWPQLLHITCARSKIHDDRGRVVLSKIEHGSLRAPFNWKRDVAPEFFRGYISRLPTLDNGLNDVQRQERRDG